MYESFYRLTGSPFLLNPDPSFFFASRGHNSAFSHLKYGIFQGEERSAVVGMEPHGCGPERADRRRQ